MNFKKTILPNGLRVILVPMQENKTVTAMVLVEAGSRYESAENNGISHFLEHMCFKGTQMRPSAFAIASDFEKLGAHYNAFTAGSYTGYYGKVSSDKAGTILEMVSDLYLNPILPESEIQKEKGVIIEEINMIQDRPERIVWDLFSRISYGEHPLGRTVIGTRETVSSFTHSELLAYRTAHYVPEKSVVIVSGQFDLEAIEKQISETFGAIPSAPAVLPEKVIENQQSPQIGIYDKATDQTHLVLGFRSFDLFDRRVYSASIMRTILGSGMSSRLFQRIREELGLCYYIQASHHLEADCGMFTISAGVSNDKVGEALSEIMKVINRFKEEGPTDEEMNKAKDYKIGSMYLSLETSDQLADWYAFQEIEREHLYTPEENEGFLRNVSREEVHAVARGIFDIKKANLALIGPHKGKEKDFLAKLEEVC